MLADLLIVEALVFISVSVAGLLLQLPHYLWNKISWAFWKKTEKLKTRIIAQYNSWVLDIPYWVLTAESLTSLDLHSDVLGYFHEEDWRQRDEGHLSPNHSWLCARRPGVCWGLPVRASGMHPGWHSVSPVLCLIAPTFPGLDSPFLFLPPHWGQEDVVPLSWK